MTLLTNVKRRFLLLASLFLLLQISCTVSTRSSYPVPIVYEEGIFEFNANLIFTQIDEGDSNLFTSVTEAGEEKTDLSHAWTEEETFRVTNAFRDEELPPGYLQGTLSTVTYFFYCDDLEQPFKNSIMRYIRQLGENGKTTHTEILFIHIHPDRNYVDYSYEIRYPAIIDWEPLDIDKVQLPFEEALQIAESSGGAETREQVNFECALTSRLNPASSNQAIWEVTYYLDSPTSPELVIEIDANSGIILSKKP